MTPEPRIFTASHTKFPVGTELLRYSLDGKLIEAITVISKTDTEYTVESADTFDYPEE